MNLSPTIQHITSKTLVGKRLCMSLANNLTAKLWQSFMPYRNSIEHRLNEDLISMQVYPDALRLGDMQQEFDKWAAVEVSQLGTIPPDMETFTIPEGLYAIFPYKGLSTDPSIFIYIFSTWLPQSGYELDQRPHFEILGKNYQNNNPNSEEDIYIPIRKTD